MASRVERVGDADARFSPPSILPNTLRRQLPGGANALRLCLGRRQGCLVDPDQ